MIDSFSHLCLGRPFVLEVLNPRKVKWSIEELQTIQNVSAILLYFLNT